MVYKAAVTCLHRLNGEREGDKSLETQSVLWLTPAEERFTKMGQEEWFGGGTSKDLEPQKSLG